MSGLCLAPLISALRSRIICGPSEVVADPLSVANFSFRTSNPPEQRIFNGLMEARSCTFVANVFITKFEHI